MYLQVGTYLQVHIYLPMKMEHRNYVPAGRYLPAGTYLPAYEDGTDRVFRNVGIYNSDAGELPKRKQNIIYILVFM